jgi:8-oxo-dGTP pyrophosphatase MutT (NUDIX family)
MSASTISTEKAKPDKLFYFVANIVVFRESDRRCLILKRSQRELVHPGKYGVIGGKLEWADLDPKKATRLNGDVLDFENSVENLLAREAKEEAGIIIDNNLQYINSVAFIRPDGIPVVLVKFAGKYVSGQVRIDSHDHSEFVWVNGEEVKNYDCLLGIDLEVAKTIEIFGG